MSKKRLAMIFPKDSEAMFNVNSLSTFGGASVQLYLLARELGQNNQLEILSIIPDYPVINFPDAGLFTLVKTTPANAGLLTKIRSYNATLRKIKPEYVVQRGLTLFSCILALYCRLSKIKFIYMLASDSEANGRYQRTNRKCALFPLLIHTASLLITQNHHQQETLTQRYHTRSELLMSGYEIPAAIPPKTNTALWVGRCDRMKHPEIFLDLARQMPQIQFVLVCSLGGDAELNQQIRTQASALPNVSFNDFIPWAEIDRYFASAKFLINTSDYEGFPQTFVQATKNGTIILSLHANPNNILREFECGLCTNGDMVKMRQALTDLSRTDDAAYRAMSEKAYAYASQYHDIHSVAKTLTDLIRC
ncbi:MAG: glycosyltransferase family 4 protein [Patescibacteria group bacterium]|jgi:glycosyltransferase involved in cell wall biosynthesis